MRRIRLSSVFAMGLLSVGLISMSPSVLFAAALTQASNIGVFGLGENDWTKTGNAEVKDDGSIEITLDDGTVLQVRLEGGTTTFVSYHLEQSMAFADGERFALEQLLPPDATYIAEYDDILPGRPEGAVRIRLYKSDDLARFLVDSSGIVLFAWQDDGTMFSVSVGR